MNTKFSTQSIDSDEYTKKAQKLYAILNIDSSDHLTVRELAEEYEKRLQITQKQSVDDYIFYLTR